MENNFLRVLNHDYDLSTFTEKTREEVENSGNKSLLSIFDAIDSNGDKKLDSSEVSVFIKIVQGFDKNNDNNIDKKELKKLLKSDISMIKEILSNGKVKAKEIAGFFDVLMKTTKPVASAENREIECSEMSDEEVQDTAINIMQDEVDRAQEIMDGQDDGVIAKSYNEI